jgi:hypothetical protein
MSIFLNMDFSYQPRTIFSHEIGCFVGVVAMETPAKIIFKVS